MTIVPVARLRARVAATRGPQFLLPRRFESVSFCSFQPDPAFPEQERVRERIAAFVAAPEPPRSRLPWRRREQAPHEPRGIYLDGRPGIGKTHLLAAAYLAAEEPKLFATFDEFAAAAGTLGVQPLKELLASRRLVCIDEIDLRDPGNIMLLTSLTRAMLAGRPRILATANAAPAGMPGSRDLAEDFDRELGEIAGAFTILRLDGHDWRAAGRSARPPLPERPRVARFSAGELAAFLHEIHPMYDAAWLGEVDLIELDELLALPDTDRALRFVRFIDRVYDRDVALRVTRPGRTLDALLAPLARDRRFVLHAARCRSRLLELGLGLEPRGAPAADGGAP